MARFPHDAPRGTRGRGNGASVASRYAVLQTRDAGARSSPARRGPRPAIPDQDLLTAIRTDLARSPWNGEGHRKVWARLRAMDGIQVSRKRVLRLMRQHALLTTPRPQAAGDLA